MALLVLAAVLSLLIGISLGLLGGGGSILTVPILIYALGVEEKSAIASSLFVVGATSVVAVIAHARAGNVVCRIALLFAAAGMVGAFLGGRIAQFLPVSLLLVLFALLMFATAFFMWRGRKTSPTTQVRQGPLPVKTIFIEGLVVGLVTGLVGAGGGFLVVPALALLGGLPMQKAVGSSLVVIALKSFAGFAGYASHAEIPWSLTAVVTAAAIVGSLGGAVLAKRVAPEQLRRGFALFVLVMAVFLLGKQLQHSRSDAASLDVPAPMRTTAGATAASTRATKPTAAPTVPDPTRPSSSSAGHHSSATAPRKPAAVVAVQRPDIVAEIEYFMKQS